MDGYKAIVRCQSRDQIVELLRLWMNDGARYRRVWLTTPESIASSFGQKQILNLYLTNGEYHIGNWSPSYYYKIAGYWSSDFEGTYLGYMRYLGNTNISVDVSDYL